MDDLFIYMIELPNGVNEFVTPCIGGYTVYINENLTYEDRIKAFQHALYHIEHNDFDKTDVQSIESDAHRKAG